MWHSFHDWLASGNWAPTFQGVATLVGVFIALGAVIWQVRSSSKRLQDQIKAQRDAEREERERERRAVAAALLAEMDCSYASQLESRHELFEYWKGLDNDPQQVEVFHAGARRPFAVYESLADKLGIFEASVARGIVLAYGLVAALTELMISYEEQANNPLGGGPPGKEFKRKSRDFMRSTIRQTAESAVQAVGTLCRVLCRISDTDFSTLVVAKDPEVGSHNRASELPSLSAVMGTKDA
jgi:hypothetical protein